MASSLNDATRYNPLQPGSTVSEKEKVTRQATTSGNELGDGFPVPAAKRVRTAPAETTTRTKTGPRAGTTLARKKQRPPATQEYGSKDDSFEYKFDSGPSDSDSDSSSSSEDEFATRLQEKEQVGSKKGSESARRNDGSKDNRERRRFHIKNDYFKTKGKVSRKDGRLKISLNETANSGYIAKALGQSIRNHLDIPEQDKGRKNRFQKKKISSEDEEKHSLVASEQEKAPSPKLNIVIMVIGSRGDIQPFLHVGKILREHHGHRVRIASHPVFRELVEPLGLEFYDAGGDPSELMAFMVKNPGLIPSMQTVRDGEIGKRRASMAEMFEGFWNACIRDDDQSKSGISSSPFVADAIIANPPSMAHVHIAERLGIPLHIMFTFPYTPTTQFPHPLANIKANRSNVDTGYVNFMSYPLVELMTWQGLGDIVNHFRENSLRLEPVSSLWAPGALYRMKVPYTYMWSPTLVPKPPDWGPEINLSGFVFLDMAHSFEPPDDLMAFLDAGESPVYIGFGSIVVDDPDKLTQMIFEAVKMAGVRALVSKGWGGFGQDNDNTPENIFMLGNTPHDWLFPKVKAVIHHGGAGTTAIGLKCSKPTMIVPFFGDQPFWGEMVASAKAGAFKCIPYKKLTAERLAEGIKQCLTEEAQANVQKIADSIGKEGDGAENAVHSFHSSLPLHGRHNMRCSILQDRVAIWRVKKSSLRLSALAAQILHQNGKFKWNEVKQIRHYAWNDFDGPGEPITGGIGAVSDSLYGIGEGFGMVPVRIAKHIREHEEHQRRKRARRRRKHTKSQTKAGQSRSQPHLQDAEQSNSAQQDTDLTLAPTQTTMPSEPLPLEVIEDLDWGLKRAGVAVLTLPNDLHVAIAQGLHNVPRLWGDATVRKPVRIKGVKSGFTAARKEFTYGIYDGWTGLVKQPKGDWNDGNSMTSKVAGLGTGLGKGLGGFVVKNTNAVYAPPAFVVKGLIKHLEKRTSGHDDKALIRRSRIIQGENDFHEMRKNDETGEVIRAIEDRVERGWAVYQEMWAAAQRRFGPAGSLVGKYRMKKEKRRWDVNGALENVDIADRTLQAQKEGHDVEDVLPQRTEGATPTAQAKGDFLIDPTASNPNTVDAQTENSEVHGSPSRLSEANQLRDGATMADVSEEKGSGARTQENGSISRRLVDDTAHSIQRATTVA